MEKSKRMAEKNRPENSKGTVYTDSSFLISLYSLDAHTADAASAMGALFGAPTVTSLVEFEVANALQQRVFWKQITAGEARRSLDDLETDLQDGVLRMMALPESLFARAARISEQTTGNLGTRAIDLLHVAAALEIRAEFLYSFDERQRKLARMMRLRLNPI